VNRHVSIRVLFFVLVAVCSALCQNSLSTDLPSTWKSVPDAPSPIQLRAQAERFHTFDNDGAGVPPRFCLSKCGHGYLPSEASDFQTPLDKERINETESVFVTPGTSHGLSTGSSFIGRASSAASGSATPSNFAVPDGAGKGKLNNSDFLGVVTSVATRAAYRVGRDRILRPSKSLVPPLVTRRSTSSTRLGLTFRKR
jgi:hypothetical protein